MLHFLAVLLDGISLVPLDFMLKKRGLQGEERVWKKVRTIFIIDTLVRECLTIPVSLGEAVFRFADMVTMVSSGIFSFVISVIVLFQYLHCRTQGIERLGRTSLLSSIGMVM